MMIDGIEYGWTQPVCDDDYWLLNPDREPRRIIEKFRDDEVCCICGKATRSGIYVRLDPSTLLHPTPRGEE